MYLIVIAGPTAVGKTALAIELAQQLQTEIISADSRQFYRGMTIGTAKPSAAELAAVPHHFIDTLEVTQDYNIGQFEQDALKLLEKLFQKHKTVLLVGGSGLYIRALCEGLDVFPEIPEALKQTLEKELETHGLAFLQQELAQHDKTYFDKIDIHNPHRVLRALSVIRATGQPFSSFQGKAKIPRPFTPIYICLNTDRAALYKRINNRVENMLEEGLLEEVRQLLPFQHYNAMQTVGYQEFIPFFEQKKTLAEAVELVKQHSRNYAKRQVTWFKKDPHWHFFEPDEKEKVLDFVRAHLLTHRSNASNSSAFKQVAAVKPPF
jgi:tRNA dimethylallyltransferase